MHCYSNITIICTQYDIVWLQLNAMANKAAGKGYEDEKLYSNIKFQFVGIANIHTMRNSLQKLVEGR